MLRTGLRSYLEQDPSIGPIGEATTGVQTLERLRERPWGLVLLDINMPDRSGLDILRHIRSSYPGTPVMIMSGLAEAQYAVLALKAGAAGYLQKDRHPAEWLIAVRTVLSGRRFVSENLRDMLVAALDKPCDQPPHATLSQRQFQILCKVALGRTLHAIARELCITPKTVSSHRARLLEKMGLRTNAELITYAVRNGLVQ
jgi:DNA-binding NarL/FixJ family response regulator